MNGLGQDIRFKRCNDVVVCEIDGGSALLDLNSSTYFRLNATGSLVWEALDGVPVSASDIADTMIETFDVDRARCLPDIVAILAAFDKAGLIEREAV